MQVNWAVRSPFRLYTLVYITRSSVRTARRAVRVYSILIYIRFALRIYFSAPRTEIIIDDGRGTPLHRWEVTGVRGGVAVRMRRLVVAASAGLDPCVDRRIVNPSESFQYRE